MADYNSVLSDAMRLSPAERAQLLDALWQIVPEENEVALHPEWKGELNHRVNAIQDGREEHYPWYDILSSTADRIDDLSGD